MRLNQSQWRCPLSMSIATNHWISTIAFSIALESVFIVAVPSVTLRYKIGIMLSATVIKSKGIIMPFYCRGSRFYNFPRLSHIVVVIHLVSFYVPLIRKFWMQFVSLKQRLLSTWKINNRAALADDVIWAVMTSRCRRDLYRRANKWRHISQLTFARWHFRVFRIILTPYLFSQPRLGLKIIYFTINIIYV